MPSNWIRFGVDGRRNDRANRKLATVDRYILKRSEKDGELTKPSMALVVEWSLLVVMVIAIVVVVIKPRTTVGAI